MEQHFEKFRKNIIGIDQTIDTPFENSKRIVYADWTASGRNYGPIEDTMRHEIMPFVANTHTETNATGMAMTHAYHKAQQIIKKHMNAGADDVMIACNSGMTGVINKFQRILGMRVHESFKSLVTFNENEKPVVFVTHMEHHSNQTSWLETLADVVVIEPNDECLVCLDKFQTQIDSYKNRKVKIAAITSCSNVTGIFTPYRQIAKMIHAVNGYCFVDFACSAPYVEIDMHPQEEGAHLDAVYFSPHKFLGGPGTPGILCFNQELYKNTVPDNPGGGTVDYTNPWGEHQYVSDIEAREDGGTPGFLQTMKAALCMNLKDEMGVENIYKREVKLMALIWDGIGGIDNLHILASDQKERLGIFSFYIDGLHYNLGVKMLNDRFGIQTRGGCSCAGTYGHYLLNIDMDVSHEIFQKINVEGCGVRPGWIRMSIHPTMSNADVKYIVKSIQELALSHSEWMKDYTLNASTGEVQYKDTTKDAYVKERMDLCLSKVLTKP